MDNYIIWFVLGLALAGAEMLVGGFYLLVCGIAAGLGGLVAWAGLGFPIQLLAAALCAIAGTFWLRRNPISRPGGPQSLDLGQRVEVEHWKSATQLRVRYRGAGWDAELTSALSDNGAPPTELYIIGQRGNTLLVAPTPPAS
ncbi:NfeD family protein [Chitinimonas sp. PSY-7]|uniref:NfeD family protein n=1 Tax=Chitinimonas sp. PSY-7 TaxID=3459088 RepID=UPI00403FE963